jgi:hypothetical protein
MAEIQNLKISNAETVEIVLQSGKRRYFFTEISDLLKGKQVVDIVALPTQCKAPSGNTIKDPTLSTLTLTIGGKEKIKNYSLGLIDPALVQVRPSFNNLICDWSKSYIEVPVTSIIGDGTESVVLVIMFND